MTDTAASFDDVVLFGGRGSAYRDIRALVRGLIGSAGMGVAAVAAVGASAAAVTVTGVWMVGVGLSGNAHLQAKPSIGPAWLALTDMAAYPQTSFEAKWARTGALMPAAARAAASRRVAAQAVPVAAASHIEREVAREQVTSRHVPAAQVANNRIADTPAAQTRVAELAWEFGAPKAGVLPPPEAAHEVAPVSTGISTQIANEPAQKVATLTPPDAPVRAPLSIVPNVPKAATAMRLPRRRPAGIAVARVPAAEIKPESKPRSAREIAALTPTQKPESRNIPALPGPSTRTALYDISGHTVYMPDGTRLEAHSGLGSKLDNPRYIRVRMRGPTPPNVYDLTLRKQLFHGVRAIRLNPVNESKMFGRDGMLAHTYMLGPNGQSNGCVSFKHYHRFLQAFLDGKIDRLVVVRNLDDAPAQLASLARRHDGGGARYAANFLNPANW